MKNAGNGGVVINLPSVHIEVPAGYGILLPQRNRLVEG